MAYSRTIDGQDSVKAKPACVHLRSKAVYVTGKVEPDHIDEIDSHEQGCWCNLTQHRIGPDEGIVGRTLCITGRPCFLSKSKR